MLDMQNIQKHTQLSVKRLHHWCVTASLFFKGQITCIWKKQLHIFTLSLNGIFMTVPPKSKKVGAKSFKITVLFLYGENTKWCIVYGRCCCWIFFKGKCLFNSSLISSFSRSNRRIFLQVKQFFLYSSSPKCTAAHFLVSHNGNKTCLGWKKRPIASADPNTGHRVRVRVRNIKNI